jgi:hypothetical protein
VYKDYFFLSKINLKNTNVKPSNIKKLHKSEILVPFFPYRLDYELFIYPIVNELLKFDLRITLVIPREALSSRNLKSLTGNLQIVIYEDLIADFQVYKEASILLKERLKHIENRYKEKGHNSLLKNIIVNYAFDYVVAEKLIKKVSPKIVYGIHFVLNPGWLDVFNKYNIKVHLIQHGFFNGDYHDFIGSDLVYLWGEYHQKRLNKMDPSIKSLVTGNPKLFIIKQMYKIEELKNNKKLYILFVSSGHTFNNKKLYNITLNAIKVIKQLNDPNLILRYKLHPSERIDDYKAWLEKSILTRDEIVDTNSVYEYLFQADIVIGAISTVLNEAAYFEKVVIRLYDNDLMDNIEDGIIKVDNHEKLNEIICRIKNEECYKKELIDAQKNKNNTFFYDDTNVIKIISQSLKNNLNN